MTWDRSFLVAYDRPNIRSWWRLPARDGAGAISKCRASSRPVRQTRFALIPRVDQCRRPLAHAQIRPQRSESRTFSLPLLHFRRTFVEKMFALHGKVELLKRDGRPLGTYARHYYDLHRLAAEAEVTAMRRSPEYAAIKADYDQISSSHFPWSYFDPEGMSFARSDALFPLPNLASLRLRVRGTVPPALLRSLSDMGRGSSQAHGTSRDAVSIMAKSIMGLESATCEERSLADVGITSARRLFPRFSVGLQTGSIEDAPRWKH